MKQKNYEAAYIDYQTGNFTYEDIAKKYKVSVNAVRQWQQRHWKKYDVQNESDNVQSAQTGNEQCTDDIQDDVQESAAVPGVKRVKDIVTNAVNKQLAETKPAELVKYDVDYWSKLNDRQRNFVLEYLIDYNATQAAIRCGYEPNRANALGIRLRDEVNIASCIAKATAERSKRTGLNADLVDIELARILRVNPINVIDMQTGEIKADATDDDLAAIQSVKVKPVIDKLGNVYYEREVRFVPKDKAIEMAMKRHNMVIDRQQIMVAQGTFDTSGMSTEELQAELNRQIDIGKTINITPQNSACDTDSDE